MDFAKYCEVLIEREKTRQAELQLLDNFIKQQQTQLVLSNTPSNNVPAPQSASCEEPLYFNHTDEIFSSTDMKGSTLVTNDSNIFNLLMESLPFFQPISISNTDVIKLQQTTEYHTAYTLTPRRMLVMTNDNTLMELLNNDLLTLLKQSNFKFLTRPIEKTHMNVQS